MPSNLFALPAAALARVPVRIGARREINPDKSGARILAQRAAYACATTIVANSRAAASRLRDEWIGAGRIAVILNGLESKSFAVAPPNPTPRIVVIVANLRPEKRHDVLIDAAPGVLARFPDARFHVVGDGPERDRLESRAAASGVSAAFHFFGHQSDVAARLEESDIFVLPSQSEAFPNAVLEAMAAGRPVVASDIDALREMIDPRRTGLLVPPADPAALADALSSLMADPARARAIGDQARAEVTARYSFDRMVAAFESLYLSELRRVGHLTSRTNQLAIRRGVAS